MSNLKQAMLAFWQEEDGLTTVEYAIAGGLVGAAVILAFVALGGTVGDVIEYIDTELSTNSPAGG